MKVQTGQGTIPLITLVGIFSISALNALPGLAVSPILGDLNKTSNPQPPSKNEIELKEKEATQKKRLKEVKIATRRHKIPLPHNAT